MRLGIWRGAILILVLALTDTFLVSAPAVAASVPVTCTISPDGESASVMLTNPLDYTASCQTNCKFATGVYDDNPQIICAKSVPAGKEIAMCILKAAGNKLTKLISATADCKKP